VLKHVTPSIAGELLGRHDLRAGRRHGQHYLVDPNTVRRIVRLADIRPDETILEIGPGVGSLTVALAQAAKHVVAVEIDEAVAGALREVLEDAENVALTVADAMHADLAALVGVPSRLVANLPYNVATPLIIRVLDEFPAVTGGLVMVQRELGERWTSTPGGRAYNAVSVRVRYHAEARIIGEVPPTVFMPPPKVESVLVSFVRREVPPVDVASVGEFFKFVQAAFAHRRKTLRNSLASGGYAKDAIAGALDALEIAERSRPEDLSLEDFARLYAELNPAGRA
jgi:16S rRNA (adenine1518-N6/adenine1519-N6)-dimethyltransferase